MIRQRATIGSTVSFRCNDDVLELKLLGRRIVMDSMAVLHGVEGVAMRTEIIKNSVCRFLADCQGTLFWQARMKF